MEPVDVEIRVGGKVHGRCRWGRFVSHWLTVYEGLGNRVRSVTVYDPHLVSCSVHTGAVTSHLFCNTGRSFVGPIWLRRKQSPRVSFLDIGLNPRRLTTVTSTLTFLLTLNRPVSGHLTLVFCKVNSLSYTLLWLRPWLYHINSSTLCQYRHLFLCFITWCAKNT